MYPTRVHPNRRYFTGPTGDPVFWLGTTQWQLFREYSIDEARYIIAKSKDVGFNVIQVMLLGVGDGTQPSIHGAKPLHDDDPAAPNEDYFRRVDTILEIAREHEVAIAMAVFHQRWRDVITLAKARAWTRWLAQRYGGLPNLVWSMNPEAIDSFIPIIRELATGLQAGDSGEHLITFKPDPAPYTSSFIHHEDWLDFNSIQTWRDVDLIVPMVSHDYHLSPTKPVVMAEGAYEAGSEYGFEVTPLWVRRQAYYTYLAGASHSYGHNDSWRVLPTWKEALDAPGAAQMGVLRDSFLARDEWWQLVPDQDLFAQGGRSEGTVLQLAARHQDGRWAMVYLGAPGECSLNLGQLKGPLGATWIDPRTGGAHALGDVSGSGLASFSTPAGWEDALLIIEAPV